MQLKAISYMLSYQYIKVAVDLVRATARIHCSLEVGVCS